MIAHGRRYSVVNPSGVSPFPASAAIKLGANREEPSYIGRRVLGMPPVWVYEVATFYNMYNLKPLGKHKVTICTNLPCALSGAEEAADHFLSRIRENTGGRDVLVPIILDGENAWEWYEANGRPFLRAENPGYPDLIPAIDLVIQGVMIALVRRPVAA